MRELIYFWCKLEVAVLEKSSNRLRVIFSTLLTEINDIKHSTF